MQEWRTVEFSARVSEGIQAWANKRIVITRSAASYTSTQLAPVEKIVIQLNAQGQGSRQLWCNDEGAIPSFYHIQLDDALKSCFCFVLPRSAPNPVGIWTLIAAGITDQMPNHQTILDYINSLGGIGGGGTINAASVNIVPSIAGLPSNGQAAYSSLLGVQYVQSIAASTWNFNHTLNRVPKIQVTDLVGNELFVEKQVTLTQAIIKSLSPVTGIVYLW